MSTEFSRGELASQFDANMADRGFLQATAKSMGVIFASEIGDKTFFIAALMAMRHPRTLVRIPGPNQYPWNNTGWPITARVLVSGHAVDLPLSRPTLELCAQRSTVIRFIVQLLGCIGLSFRVGLQVFIGCAGALAAMTVLSTVLGAVTPTLVCSPCSHQPTYIKQMSLCMTAWYLQIPKIYTHWASIMLFFYFGLTSLKEVLFAPKVRCRALYSPQMLCSP